MGGSFDPVGDTLYGSGSLHRIHASVRARDRDRGFGGSALLPLL